MNDQISDEDRARLLFLDSLKLASEGLDYYFGRGDFPEAYIYPPKEEA